MKEKIRLLSDLNSILEDEEILKLIGSKPNGTRVVEIFKLGIEREIEGIFNKTLNQVIDPVSELLLKIKESNDQLDSIIQKTTVIPKTVSPVQAAQVPSQSSLIANAQAPVVANGSLPSFQGKFTCFD